MQEIKVSTEFGKIYVKGVCEETNLISEGNIEDRTHISGGTFSTRILFQRHFKEEWYVEGIILHCNVFELMKKNGNGILELIGKEYSAIDQKISNEEYQVLANSSDKNNDYVKSIRKPDYLLCEF